MTEEEQQAVERYRAALVELRASVRAQEELKPIREAAAKRYRAAFDEVCAAETAMKRILVP